MFILIFLTVLRLRVYASFEDSEMYCGLENMSIKISKEALDVYLDKNEPDIYIGPKEANCKTSGVIMNEWYLFETRLG